MIENLKGKKYEPSNFLLTDLKTEGSDLVELVGIATGYLYSKRRIPEHIIDDMEKAVEKARATILGYRRAVEKKIESLNRDDFTSLCSNSGDER